MCGCRTLRYGFVVCFNDTATTEIYTLSLHDALPIYLLRHRAELQACGVEDRRIIGLPRLLDEVAVRGVGAGGARGEAQDRKSTRLNSVTPISRMPSSA